MIDFERHEPAILPAMYTVKETAELLGTSVHTVRYYDNLGLIPGTSRGTGKQRLFDDDAVEWLFVCLALRKAGMPLKDVKKYISLYQKGEETVPERYGLMLESRKNILSEIRRNELCLKFLDRKLEHYGKIMDGSPDTWDHDFIRKLIWNDSGSGHGM